MEKGKRVAIYGRVSTDGQTTDNQVVALKEVAARRGWDIAEVYIDHGISGANGRDKRPGFDRMLKDASRRKFDVVMAWAIDRMGRSLRDLVDTLDHLNATGVDLYLDQQNIDTTVPAGRLLFQVTGATLRQGRGIRSQDAQRGAVCGAAAARQFPRKRGARAVLCRAPVRPHVGAGAAPADDAPARLDRTASTEQHRACLVCLAPQRHPEKHCRAFQLEKARFRLAEGGCRFGSSTLIQPYRCS